MKSIVVGFDEGEESDDALAFGRALAEAEEATLKVAVALDYAPVPIEVEAYDRALAEHFDEIFARAERQLGGVEFERLELRDSSPARALTELGEADDSSLIVIGSTHRGALGRVYPGSVGERLVNGAPCPVAIAPRGFARKEQFDLGLIGVGYDGTEESRLALSEAEDLAKQRGANLRLIAAVPYVDPMPGRIGHTAVGFRDLLQTYYRKVLDTGVSTVSIP
jgi:nucleotide-binding universal stress UspA family protein